MDLQDHMAGAYPEPPIDDEEARTRWIVDDDGAATWAARKLTRYAGEVAALEAQADEERERVDRWLADAASGARAQAEYFEGKLVDYAVRLHAQDPDGDKTHKFLGGKVWRKKLPDRVEFTDEAAFVEWALGELRHELLTIKPSVSAVKALLGDSLVTQDSGDLVVKDSGEVMPGVAHVAGSERYYGKAVG